MPDRQPLLGSELVQARDALIAAAKNKKPSASRKTQPAAADLRLALTDAYELWLTKAARHVGITPDSNIALLAVGSFARKETLPYSDLDLVLLHDAGDEINDVAEALWYPLWDSHIPLDHSVRTVTETLRVAQHDMTAALGLLDARYIAGDEELASLVITGVRRQWQQRVADNFDPLLEETMQRWRRSGYIAHRMDPDLKNGRGGPRDVQYLRALSLAQLVDSSTDTHVLTPGRGLNKAYSTLIDIRTELHITAGRARDVMHPQDADDIARRLGIGDRFDLARQLSDSARTISFATEVGIRTARNALPRKGLARFKAAPIRLPLDEGVVEHNGEVALARGVSVSRDSGLILRVAAAAARAHLPISAATLRHLADHAPEIRDQWSGDNRDDLLTVLSAGRSTEAVIESLDRSGLWARLFPEWGPVRDLPPRDPAHIYTVDRHLVQTVVEAGRLSSEVHRPDLLLVAALFHDVGKGRGGDHSKLGAKLIDVIAHRMGFNERDRATLRVVVLHHLLLSSDATTKDLDDLQTAADVAQQIDNNTDALEVLIQLSEADSRATGPGVWNTWRHGLIQRLAFNVRAVVGGGEQQPPEIIHLVTTPSGPAELQVRLETTPEKNTFVVTVSAHDERGLLSKTAAVLAYHGLAIRHADVTTDGEFAANRFIVSTLFGSAPSPEIIAQDLRRALEGTFDASKQKTARSAVSAVPVRAEPRILWSLPTLGSQKDEWTLEIRASDQPGLLGTMTHVLEENEISIRWASVDTFGSLVVDNFGVTVGSDVDRDAVTAHLVAALPPAEPAVEAEEDEIPSKRAGLLRRKPRGT